MLRLTLDHNHYKKRYYLGDDYADIYLTEREMEVLKTAVCCYKSKEIAGSLGLSVRTVEYYFNNIKQKLSCRWKKDLIRFVLASRFMDQLEYIESTVVEL